MFNPDIQYRCTIIRGKAQRELDNLLSAYSNIISEVCPCTKEKFDDEFNDKLSYLVYNKNYSQLSFAHKKTIRNHITEIAGKLFGLFFERDGLIYESQNNIKLLEDNDQPAFFKNLCLNFQFPNGTQKIQTVLERIDNDIKFKPFHFIVSLLKLAKNKDIFLTKDEIGYYVLNAKQVLQGKVTPQVVLDKILLDRSKNLVKRVGANSRDFQHIREQLNLLSLANIIVLTEQSIYLNESEKQTIELFIQGLEEPLQFDMSKYKLPYDSKKMSLFFANFINRL